MSTKDKHAAVRVRIFVSPAPCHGGRAWRVEVQNGPSDGLEKRGFRTQRDALRWAIAEAKGWQAASVYVQRPNGRYREERTFPRASDPRRTKG